MKNQIIGLLAGIIISLSTTAQISSVVKDTLDKKFNEIVKSYNAKGVGAAIHFKDGSVWEAAYGNYGTEKLTTDLLYDAGSNTKTMIATLVLLLEEDGKLSIDDSLGKHIIPTVNINGQVTIKQLLNHTSGLASFTDHKDYYPNVNNNWDSILPVDTVLKYFVDPPLFTPGLRVEYTNTGYILLGKIIEAVEGKKLAESMRARLFFPTQLDNTYLAFYENYTKKHLGTWLSSGYLADLPVSFLSSAWAAGAVICEPADLAKWAFDLYSGKILSKESFDKMNETLPYANNQRYGLGMISSTIAGRPYLGHGGQTLQTSSMEYSIDGEYSIVFMNIEDGQWGQTMGMRARMIIMLEELLPNVVVPEDTTSLVDASKNEAGLNVYPYPAIESVTVEFSNAIEFEYQVISAQGQLITIGSSQGGKTELYKKELGEGLFWIRAFDQKGSVIIKPIQFR